jgi:hypothetical protein
MTGFDELKEAIQRPCRSASDNISPAGRLGHKCAEGQ